MLKLLLLCLHALIYPTHPQNAFSDLIGADTCIPYDEYAFFCTTLLRLENIQDENTDIIQTYLGVNHTYNQQNYNFIYQHIKTTAINQNIAAQLTCFVYPVNDSNYGGSIQYTLYNNSAIITDPIGSITLNNIGLIMDTNQPSETIYATFTDNIAAINYPILPIAQISAYIANVQCIEILSFIPTNSTSDHWFYIEGEMWRTTDVTLTATDAQFFTTQERTNTNHDEQIRFNAMYCFQETPINNQQSLAFLFTVKDYTDNNRQYEATDNYITHDLLITDWTNLSEVEYYTIDFTISGDIASLEVALWQSCNITANITPNNNDGNDVYLIIMRNINDDISFFTTIFLITICVLGTLTILIVAYLSKTRYKSSDPINYFAIIWMVLELWDFFSDLAYVFYLYYFTVYYERFEFWIMFIIGTLFLFVPYTLNLCYYSFLNQLWQQDKAPFSAKRWLKRYSWIFLLICLVTGGVHPALELTNSLLFPRQLFAMHLPYSEIIRVRSERFVTNVLFENFPFLILQITFYFVIQSIESELNGGINIVFWGTVVSSILSVLFSGTYYFSYKYRLQSSIAIYSFSFGFRTMQFEHYWVHSHWRLQTAISKALQIGTPSLVVIDKATDVKKKNKKKFIEDDGSISMYVEGRIINDPSSVKSKLKLMEHDLKQNEQREAMTEIGTTLIYLLRNEFNLTMVSDEVKVINLRIKNINQGNGENMFRLKYEDTLKNVCCWRCVGEIKLDSNYHLESLHSSKMSDFGRSSSNKNMHDGIFIADKHNKLHRNDKKDDDESQEPEYLKQATLPMVSISAADANDKEIYDPQSDPKNIKKQRKKNGPKLGPKHAPKHRPQFSTISVVNDDPNAIDELRRHYHE